jgi:hypothetical protein
MDYVHQVLKGLSLERITRDLPPRAKTAKKPDVGEQCRFYCIKSGEILYGVLLSWKKKESVTYCVVKTCDGEEHCVTTRGLFAA